jgi:hypothetical protein
MSTSTSPSSRRGLGGFAAVVGGAAMIVSVFLPWLSFLGTASVKGWDTYSLSSGAEKFYANHAFDSDFSPMFTGMSVLIAGSLMALIGLAMLGSLRGGAFRLHGAGRLVLGLLAVLVFVAGITNLVSLYATGPGSGLLDPGYGLFVLTAGAVVGFLGVTAGVSGGR